MGHGTQRGNAELPVRHDAGGAYHAADVRCARAQHGGVVPLCPPGAELHHRAALRRTDNAVRLGGDQALMVEGDQKQRLDELGLDGRALHDDDGLVGENGRALGHSPDIAVEFKAAQIVEELLGEAALAPQVFDVLFAEVKVIHYLTELLQARGNGKAAAVGYLAEEHVEHAHLVGVAFFEIAGRHGQLVEIHQKRQVACVVDICHHRFRLSLLYLLHLFQKQKGASVLARRAEGEIVFEEAEVKLVRPGAGGTGGGRLSRRRRNAAPG